MIAIKYNEIKYNNVKMFAITEANYNSVKGNGKVCNIHKTKSSPFANI